MRIRLFVDTRTLTKQDLSKLRKMTPAERRAFFLDLASRLALDDEAMRRIERAWRRR